MLSDPKAHEGLPLTTIRCVAVVTPVLIATVVVFWGRMAAAVRLCDVRCAAHNRCVRSLFSVPLLSTQLYIHRVCQRSLERECVWDSWLLSVCVSGFLRPDANPESERSVLQWFSGSILADGAAQRKSTRARGAHCNPPADGTLTHLM